MPYNKLLLHNNIKNFLQNIFLAQNLEESLLFISHNPNTIKADVKDRTLTRIKEIQEKISDLTRIKTALEHLAASCDGHGSLDECAILEALN